MKIGMTMSASKRNGLLNPIKRKDIALYRYNCFRNVFGKDNYRVLFADDLKLEGNCPVYTLTKEIKPLKVNEEPIFDIFLAATVNQSLQNNLITFEDIKEEVNLLENMLESGRVKKIINKPSSLYMEDKAKILDLQEFNIPRTYVGNNGELSDILKQEGVLISKPRFGEDGKGIYRLQEEKDIRIGKEHCIFQQEIDYREEIRIIFYDYRILAARTIIDRTRPWESNGRREHKLEPYIPSTDETDDTIQIAKKFDLKTGCVDWLKDHKDERFLLEVNGFGTGLGYPEGVYDVNKEFAHLVLEETQ